VICATCGAANRDEARFCDSCGARLDAPRKRELRKVVTVLFCDVAGSTALGETLDPEALRAVMGRYFDVAKAAIERHGGTLEKFIGDAVMAVFGVPTIREDDALRAVRAAQEIRDGVDIDVRIGVNTGEVVTSVEDSLVTGDAVNVAARLEQAAGSGEVLLGEETYHLVRDAVQVDELPPLEVKGKSMPLLAYRLGSVTGDTPYARRLDAPLIGRDVERALLAGAWQRSCDERACSLFTILGAAGVGKSRLAAEFLAGLDATIVSGRCLSYGDGITYWPVVEVVMRLLAGATPPNAPLAALLGDGQAAAPDISLAVRKLFETKAAERPLVVVFDDVQWAEPTLLDLIEEAADWIRGAPILILCLARPELLDVRPTWGGGKLNATTVLLEPLTPDQTEELIDVLLAGTTLEGSVRRRVREAADGNPLFVEQMLAMVADDHGEGELAVPATIQALLAARIDQLPPPERAALERGAIEGQIFHRGAVVALAPDDPEVPARLLRLVRKELVRPSEAVLPGDDAFRFRHLLIRDAAYDALPKSVRADLHQRFAAWLSEHGTSVIELDEILGFHLEQAARYLAELGAGDPQVSRAAAGHLVRSGRRAYNRSDLPAAASLLTRAAALFDETEEERLRILVILGSTLYRSNRLEEADRVLREAIELARAHDVRGVEVDAGVILAEVDLHRLPDEKVGQSRAWEAVRAAIAWAEAVRCGAAGPRARARGTPLFLVGSLQRGGERLRARGRRRAGGRRHLHRRQQPRVPDRLLAPRADARRRGASPGRGAACPPGPEQAPPPPCAARARPAGRDGRKVRRGPRRFRRGGRARAGARRHGDDAPGGDGAAGRGVRCGGEPAAALLRHATRRRRLRAPGQRLVPAGGGSARAGQRRGGARADGGDRRHDGSRGRRRAGGLAPRPREGARPTGAPRRSPGACA
jgi:class 3 adenylate cyclase